MYSLKLRLILINLFLFCAFFICANLGLRFISHYIVAFDCPKYWPVSVVFPRIPDLFSLGMFVFSGLLCFAGVRWLGKTGYRIYAVIGCALVVLIASTAIQGINGFIRPISGAGVAEIQYYQDAITIHHPLLWMRNFTLIQTGLQIHSQVHPPGAVLLVYGLWKVFVLPFWITVVMGGISTILSLAWIYKVYQSEFDTRFCGYLTFLFAMLPAVQIYYFSSLDAVCAALVFGAIAYTLDAPRRMSTMFVCVLVIIASFLSYLVSMIVLPALLVWMLFKKRYAQFFQVLGAVILFYILLNYVFGYNYIQSFMIASRIEHPKGFMLFAQPLNYFFTRIEDIAEIAFFAGPFISIIFMLGLGKQNFKSDGVKFSKILGGFLLLSFFAGAFKSGETARITLFVLPYLLIPVGHYIQKHYSMRQQYILLLLVFVQGLVMQLLGDFFW